MRESDVERQLKEGGERPDARSLGEKIFSITEGARDRISDVYSSGKRVLNSNKVFVRMMALSIGLHVVGPTAHAVEHTIEDVRAYIAEDVPERYKKVIKEEVKLVEKRNERRKSLVEKNARKAENYRDSLADKFEKGEEVSYTDAVFDMEELSQGVDPAIIKEGRNNLNSGLDKLNAQKPAVPNKVFLQKVVDTFAPGEAGEDTRSSAAEALALIGEEGTQNCVARTKIITMALSELYPDRKKDILLQQFGGHQRIVFGVGKGKFVMEGKVQALEKDEAHNRASSEIMPAENIIRGYAGAKLADRQFVDRGSNDKSFPRVSDDMIDYNIAPSTGVKLGNYSTAEETYGRGFSKQRIRNNEENERKLRKIVERMNKPMELELLSESLSEQQIRSRINPNSLELNLGTIDQKVDEETVKRINRLANAGHIKKLYVPIMSDFNEDVISGLLMPYKMSFKYEFSLTGSPSKERQSALDIKNRSFQRLKALADLLQSKKTYNKIEIFNILPKYLDDRSISYLATLAKMPNVVLHFNLLNDIDPDSFDAQYVGFYTRLLSTLKKSRAVVVTTNLENFVYWAGICDPSVLDEMNYRPFHADKNDVHTLYIIKYHLESKGKITKKNKERLERFIDKVEQIILKKNPEFANDFQTFKSDSHKEMLNEFPYGSRMSYMHFDKEDEYFESGSGGTTSGDDKVIYRHGIKTNLKGTKYELGEAYYEGPPRKKTGKKWTRMKTPPTLIVNDEEDDD